jgi:hypothetical protein
VKLGRKPQVVTPNACICGDHFWLPIGRGLVTLVAPEDASLLKRKWKPGTPYTNGKTPVIRTFFESLKRFTVFLHREIMGAVKGQIVDHANGNPLDNRRCNLRLCTPQENSRHRDVLRGFKFKGMTFEQNLWRVRIRTGDGKKLHVGTFHTQEEAALAYDAAALQHFGEFARLNSESQNVGA